MGQGRSQEGQRDRQSCDGSMETPVRSQRDGHGQGDNRGVDRAGMSQGRPQEGHIEINKARMGQGRPQEDNRGMNRVRMGHCRTQADQRGIDRTGLGSGETPGRSQWSGQGQDGSRRPQEGHRGIE